MLQTDIGSAQSRFDMCSIACNVPADLCLEFKDTHLSHPSGQSIIHTDHIGALLLQCSAVHNLGVTLKLLHPTSMHIQSMYPRKLTPLYWHLAALQIILP